MRNGRLRIFHRQTGRIQVSRTIIKKNGVKTMGNGILIVDDAAFMRMVIKDILVKAGYEVAGEAADGKEAIHLYRTLKPELVLLDITMPEMDGVDALKKIMQEDRNAKVIMCSALGQSSMVIECIQAGAKDYIVKPFQADRVIESIRKLIG